MIIGTDALSKTRIDCGSAIPRAINSVSNVRNGNLSHIPITTKSISDVGKNKPVRNEPKISTRAFGHNECTTASIRNTTSLRNACSAGVGST